MVFMGKKVYSYFNYDILQDKDLILEVSHILNLNLCFKNSGYFLNAPSGGITVVKIFSN